MAAMEATFRRKPNKHKPRLNKNGIPINKHINLALLEVCGVGDPFEGRKYDPGGYMDDDNNELVIGRCMTRAGQHPRSRGEKKG